MLPATRWSSSTPSRWPGPGANARTSSSRWSAPSSRSTTIPSTRRSSPHTFSTSSASCTPSTQIRLPRATRAGAPTTARLPDAVRRPSATRGPSSAGARTGTRWVGVPSTANVPGQVGVATLEPRVATQDDLVAVERDQRAGEPGRAVQHPHSGCRLAVGILGGGAFGTVDRPRQDPAGRCQGRGGGVRRSPAPARARPASTSPACA